MSGWSRSSAPYHRHMYILRGQDARRHLNARHSRASTLITSEHLQHFLHCKHNILAYSKTRMLLPITYIGYHNKLIILHVLSFDCLSKIWRCAQIVLINAKCRALYIWMVLWPLHLNLDSVSCTCFKLFLCKLDLNYTTLGLPIPYNQSTVLGQSFHAWWCGISWCCSSLPNDASFITVPDTKLILTSVDEIQDVMLGGQCEGQHSTEQLEDHGEDAELERLLAELMLPPKLLFLQLGPSPVAAPSLFEESRGFMTLPAVPSGPSTEPAPSQHPIDVQRNRAGGVEPLPCSLTKVQVQVQHCPEKRKFGLKDYIRFYH